MKKNRFKKCGKIKSNQIIYTCANKNSKNYKLSTNIAKIDNKILSALKKFKIGDKEFQEYIKFTNIKLDDIEKNIKEKLASKNLEIGRLESAKINYIKKNMSKVSDNEEKTIYEETKKIMIGKFLYLKKKY